MRPQAAIIWSFCILTVIALALSACEVMPPDEDPARELREIIAPALGLEFKGELTQGHIRADAEVGLRHSAIAAEAAPTEHPGSHHE